MTVATTIRQLASATWGALWPSQPPRPQMPDATREALTGAVLGQLVQTLEALPSWPGAVDAESTSRCTYGHTHVSIRSVRTSPASVATDQRLAPARRLLREMVATYCARALPGDGFEQHRACGDSVVTIGISWLV